MKIAVSTEDDYEDLLGLWSDLESGLGIVLRYPDCTQEFVQRIEQYDRWMQDLLAHDTDVGLYLLFQLSIHSIVGYSASHALVCAVLCHLLALEFNLPRHERDSLVRAAFTMNIAMTELQDQLALQSGRPTPEQQTAIQTHAVHSMLMLEQLGVSDALWLKIVQIHHREATEKHLDTLTPAQRLAHLLHIVDLYAAMISPRESREGRSAAESAQHILGNPNEQVKPVGQALVRVIGLCPPGTLVQLENDEIAMVMHRSSASNRPDVAIVIDNRGHLIKPPRLHHTASNGPAIKAALVNGAIKERLDHHLILQLGLKNS